ncbi:MAG: LUD domain-containing protein [Vicinamibacteraceae bacterium]|nr:LUD domain-containing protein [Vicinamibacteraceae bacterium]
MSDRVIARVRASLGEAIRRGMLPGADAAHPGPRPPAGPLASPPDGTTAQSALLQRFAEQANLVGATVDLTASLDDAVHAVREALRNASLSGTRRFVAWHDAALDPVLDAMVADGWTRVDDEVPAGDEARRATRVQDVAACDVGVTTALAALAETGSIVVASGPGRGRLVSLLPPVHIAIVTTADVHVSLAAWLGTLGQRVPPANLVIITGPSRTADIEQTLTRGVHGPKALHIVVVPG